MKSNRNLLKFWVGYIIFLVAFALYYTVKGISFDQDFLSLFSSKDSKDRASQASKVYESRLSDEIVFLSLSSDQSKAVQGAKVLYQQILSSSLFTDAQVNFSSESQDNFFKFAYGRRMLLLDEVQRHEIDTGHFSEIQNRALQNLYSPVGVSSTLSTDPLGLFQNYVARTSSIFKFRPQEGFLIGQRGELWGVLIRAKVVSNIPNLNSKLVQFYENLKKPHELRVEYLALGAPLFVAHGSEVAVQEMSLYGTISFLLVIALLFISFSSMVPVLVSGLTIVVSVTAGLLGVLFIFSSVHILSLLMGVSVLGVVTDYCTHFFSKGYDENVNNSHEVFEKIKGALGIGFLTNMLTYACFYFTDLLILKQLSVFTMAGVLTTYLTVVCVFPHLRFRRLKTQSFMFLSFLSIPWLRFGRKKSVGVILVLLCAGAFFGGDLKFDDDVRLLQSIKPQLKSDETQIRSFIGLPRLNSYYLVSGKNSEEVLQREEKLVGQLRDMKVKSLGVSSFVPSLLSQSESALSYRKLEPVVRDFYKKISAPVSKQTTQYLNGATPSFSIEQVLADFPDLPIQRNWIGRVGDRVFSSVQIMNESQYSDLKQLDGGNFRLVDKVKDATLALRTLRIQISYSFIVVFIVLALFLIFKFGFIRGLLIIFPPCVSALATLLIGNIIMPHINVFSILALILIFCLGMDYSVFFSQTESEDRPTRIGIFISVLSTIISFGILSLSSTNAVSSFGITVFIGIIICYLLAPISSVKSS